MDDPDLAWLRRVADGDEGALERLYARHLLNNARVSGRRVLYPLHVNVFIFNRN
ncbi:hypothetical protein GCM10020218_080560 [Dactylosporangium vinaceum]